MTVDYFCVLQTFDAVKFWNEGYVLNVIWFSKGGNFFQIQIGNKLDVNYLRILLG